MEEIRGNLIDLFFEGHFDAIIHGCNCRRNFGAGIAKEIKQRIPSAYEADLNHAKLRKYNRPMDFSTTETNFGTVINLYTQYNWGRAKETFDTKSDRYMWIRLGLRKINIEFSGKTIGMPLIGCGHAGLEWSNVKKIIYEVMTDCRVIIVHYKF